MAESACVILKIKMYKSLYDTFSHWFHDGKGQVWFYSDSHFGDEEMRYIRKNYIGDEDQVKHINSKVGKYDTLVILGDIGDIECVRKLHGYKVLIMGNHDKGASNYKRIKTDEVRQGSYEYVPDYIKGPDGFRGAHIWKEVVTQPAFDNHLFDEVYEGPLMISEKILLSHEPIDFPYVFNIHGHDHSNSYFKDGRHLNMCAEWINYTPIALSQIIKSGLLSDIETIHRNTIDRATERKRKREEDEKEDNQ